MPPRLLVEFRRLSCVSGNRRKVATAADLNLSTCVPLTLRPDFRRCPVPACGSWNGRRDRESGWYDGLRPHAACPWAPAGLVRARAGAAVPPSQAGRPVQGCCLAFWRCHCLLLAGSAPIWAPAQPAAGNAASAAGRADPLNQRPLKRGMKLRSLTRTRHQPVAAIRWRSAGILSRSRLRAGLFLPRGSLRLGPACRKSASSSGLVQPGLQLG